jgi:hypothetical protein
MEMPGMSWVCRGSHTRHWANQTHVDFTVTRVAGYADIRLNRYQDQRETWGRIKGSLGTKN